MGGGVAFVLDKGGGSGGLSGRRYEHMASFFYYESYIGLVVKCKMRKGTMGVQFEKI